MRSAFISILVAVLIAPLSAQSKPRSEQQCAAQLPPADPHTDNSAQQERDSIYYSCLFGVGKDDVRNWLAQLAQGYDEGRYGQLWDAITAKNKFGEFAILTTMAGTAHCQDITVMKKSADTWAKVWVLPDRLPLRLKHCAKACPLMKVSLDRSGVLSIGIPADSNMEPQFKCRLKWLRYRWDGKTFAARN